MKTNKTRTDFSDQASRERKGRRNRECVEPGGWSDGSRGKTRGEERRPRHKMDDVHNKTSRNIYARKYRVNKQCALRREASKMRGNLYAVKMKRQEIVFIKSWEHEV